MSKGVKYEKIEINISYISSYKNKSKKHNYIWQN